MAATLFVKAGAEYIRVATSVLNPDGSGRAVGTVLGGAALDSIKAGKPYYGEVQVLGTAILLTTSLSKTHRAKPSASNLSATRGDAAIKDGSRSFSLTYGRRKKTTSR